MVQAGLRKLSRLLGALFLLVGLAGCDGGDESIDPTANAKIVTFELDTDTLTEGESTTLRWSTKHALSVSLLVNGFALPDQDFPVDGELEVSPLNDTSYRLEAKGKEGTWTYADAFLEVRPFGPPVVDRFEASKSVVGREGEVELSWSVRGATDVSIFERRGRQVGSGLGSEGTVSVQPAASTVYVLQAQNLHGSATSEVAVSVGKPPTIALRTDKEVVLFGEELVLSWTVSDAESLILEDPLGEVLHEGPGTAGELTLTPETSGLYRAVARGIGGESISSALVSIKPVIDSFSVTVQGQARVGSQALVQWETRGAESLTVTNSGGVSMVLEGASGQQAVPVGAGGGFILRAASGPHTAEASAVAEVSERPLIFSLETRGLVTAGQGESGIATVLWHIDGASKLRLDVEPGGMVDLVDKNPRKDEVDVLFIGPGVIRLTAFNSAGETVMEIPSPVDPVPTVSDFFAAPSRVGMGESVDIHWSTLDAQTVILEKDGVDVGAETTMVNGSFPIPVLSTQSSYVLRAFNGLGFEVVSEPLIVEVGAPNALSLTTTDGRSRYSIGSTIGLQWANDGGTALTLYDKEDGRVIHTSNDPLEIRRGSWSVELPLEQMVKNYVMEVSNASGTDSMELQVQAVTGPIIEEFYSEFDEVTEGDTLVFFWKVSADSDGNVPTLTMTDNKGNEYPMDDVDDPLEGWRRHQIGAWEGGDYVFTLTATSPNPPAFNLSHSVTVYGIPIVDTVTSNPPFADQEGDDVVLSWTTTHGVSMEVFLIDGAGEIVGEPIFSTDDPIVTQGGNQTVTPKIATPHVKLRVRNPLGRVTDRDFRIGVNPATVSTFTANGVPAPNSIDILLGDEVNIEWDTERSTKAYFYEGFFDLSQRPTAIDLGLADSGDSGMAYIDLPFAFPYDGAEYSTLRATVDGMFSFDIGLGINCCNPLLPTPTTANNRKVHIFPFWDDQMTNRSTPGGTIYWEYFPDAEMVIIQWHDMNIFATGNNPSALNYQTVLHKDGRFEFRYGHMSSINEPMGRGSGASIGAQNFLGTAVNYISHNVAHVDGLEGRVWYFDAWDNVDTERSHAIPTPLSGSLTLNPSVTTTYRLKAWNGHSDHVEELTVNVHPRASVVVSSNPPEPGPGTLTSLVWSGKALTSLVIEEEGGNVIHTATQAQLDLGSGSFGLGPLTEGDHNFTFRGVGRIPQDTIEVNHTVHVAASFSLDSFEVSETLIKRNQPVDLSWGMTNATSAIITERAPGKTDVETVLTGQDLVSGTMKVFPDRTTTYILEMESHGRKRQESRTVEVRTVWIDHFSLSSNVIKDGDDLFATIFTSPGGRRTFHPVGALPTPMLQDYTAPFEDISGLGQAPLLGTALDSGLANAVFPTGFTFPYFGKEYSFVRVAVDGYISFDGGLTTVATNAQLPGTTVANQRMHLPIFWDDLHSGTNGRVDAVFLPNPDRFIVQWTNYHRFAPSTNRNWNLNFQIVLFPDGSFEYRYGTMEPPPDGTTSTSNCNPLSCEEEAQGSSATIGFQDPTGTYYHELHFGGASSANDPPVPGGLAERAFRFEPYEVAEQEIVEFTPTESGKVLLCIEDEYWRECQEISYLMIEPGDIIISEVMVNPVGGLANQWFEIRNVSAGEIDLEGMAIKMGGQSHVIESGGPILIPMGGHAVLARSNDPTLNPTYVYVPGLELTAPAGDVSIEWRGTVLGSASWTSSWTIPQGASLELKGEKTRPGVVTRSTFSDYCVATTSYGIGANMGSPGSYSKCVSNGYILDPFSDKEFIDIRHTGNRSCCLNGVNQASRLSGMAWDFPFYNDFYDSHWMNSNGLMGFDPSVASTSGTNRDLTGTGTTVNTGIIAAFWEALAPSETGTSWVGLQGLTRNGMRVQIVQWDKVKVSASPGEITFQVQLWENGDIVIAYGEIIGDALFRGSSATVGIEAPGGSPEVQYLFNEALLRDHQVLHFRKL